MHWSSRALLAVSTLLSIGTQIYARGVEYPASREYFYIGGEWTPNPAGGQIITNQLYVEHLSPIYETTQDYPIVLWHGQAQTGTNFLNTPDGRPGWASYFLNKGYEVYIVDQPQRGRSPYDPGVGQLSVYSAETIESLFTGIQWFGTWPQAKLHTQWPGNGTIGDEVFDQFYASQIDFQNIPTTVSTINQKAGAALLDKIGPVHLIGHSQAGPISYLISDARPDLVKTLVVLEPEGPPFENRVISNLTTVTRPYGLTNIPLTYEPAVSVPAVDLPFQSVPAPAWGLTDCLIQKEPAKKLPNLAKVPIAVLTSEASFHAGYDYCEVKYLQQAGVNAQYLNLSSMGIHGNAHFMFMELNNWQIADVVEAWVSNATKHRTG